MIRNVPNRERIVYDELLQKLCTLLFTYQGMIRITILKNIALVTYALLNLFSGARGSNGQLSKAALLVVYPWTWAPRVENNAFTDF
jgi:hypothetical protein